jgi:hypothetical protein
LIQVISPFLLDRAAVLVLAEARPPPILEAKSKNELAISSRADTFTETQMFEGLEI